MLKLLACLILSLAASCFALSGLSPSALAQQRSTVLRVQREQQRRSALAQNQRARRRAEYERWLRAWRLREQKWLENTRRQASSNKPENQP